MASSRLHNSDGNESIESDPIDSIFEYPIASIVLQTKEPPTLAVGSGLALDEQHDLWCDVAAATVLSSLPIAVVFLLAQRWMVGG